MDTPSVLYGSEPALPALLAAARDELDGAGVPTDHLCIASGALDGVQRVLSAQLRPGDRVAVEDPGYTNALDLLRALGLVTVPVAVDDAGMRPDALAEALERSVDSVLLTPRGQNPTGAALDAERAVELRDVLAAAPDVLVIEDDHLGAVSGVPGHTTIAGRRRWAFVRSVAKSLGPDLRLAFLAGDAETVARVEGLLELGPGWVSHVVQRIVLGLVTDPSVGRLLDRAAATYGERRKALVAELFDRGIEAHGRTGFNVWIPVPDEVAAMQALRDAGYLATPGARYRLASRPAVRVTVSTLSPDEAGYVADALARSLAPSQRTRAA
jgi:DNA-binding transcriptional MocR family regulator